MSEPSNDPRSPAPPSPEAERLLRRRCDGDAVYRGTREQLITAGLALAGDFPGEPGGPVASRTYERCGRKFILSINSRVANPMTYWLRVTATNAELKYQREQRRSALRRTAPTNEPEPKLAENRYKPVVRDDDEWPPHCGHNPAIEIGDGTRWHYCGAPDALLLAGLLDANEIPGNPACSYRWHYLGSTDGKLFMAVRVGKRVAVTLLGEGVSIIRCVPLNYKVA